MPVGLNLYNEDLVLQISDTTPNFALKYRGTLTPTAGARFPYEVSVQGDGLSNPIIAIEPGSTSQIVCLTRLTQLDADSFLWRFACSTNSPFIYYIFDKYSTAIAAAADEGARIYINGTTDIAWSTAEFPLRIVGGGTSLPSLPAGRVYAGIQTEIGTATVSSAAPVESPYAFSISKSLTGIRRTSATNLAMVNYVYSTYLTNTAPGTYSSGSPILVAVDVTNLTASAGLVGSGDPADVTTAANWANISTSGISGSTSATINDIGTAIEMSAVASNADINTVIKVNGSIVDNPFTVDPDDVVLIEVENTSGTSETDSIVVRNITNANVVVDTISVSLGPVYDYVPNAVNWATINSGSYIGTNTAQTITGIGGPINISWSDTASNVTVRARVNGGAWQSSPVTVTNGQTVQFQAENFAAISRTGTVTVRNNTDPTNPILDTFNVVMAAAP